MPRAKAEVSIDYLGCKIIDIPRGRVEYLASERSERDTLGCNAIEISVYLLASERSELAQPCSCSRSIKISDTFVYICGRTSTYMRMLGGT